MRQLQWLFADPQSAFSPTTGFQARLRCICCQETAYTKVFSEYRNVVAAT